ncbi:tRNA pseudouridine(38-40) synthase TruA [Caviibacter abscessus]|uniref:tRNA pseudouridine(38-40) synthase TruA n=1 Tax=Caviibacter abscessus TaxID=1766719 RepID=UPI000837B831|nr:tRNA pseudouridine(38-40) synthase TruA [Caviibacter abscessus]
MDIKIKYSYDGSKFYGLQRQKDKITVQGEIERILLTVFNEKINLISSGRTDTNVHAIEQVSNFSISKNIPLSAIKTQLNKSLYGKIKINEIEYCNNFNSRFDAKSRTYVYYLRYEENISPFEANYITSIKTNIDIEKVNEKLSLFIGEHDFLMFSKKDKESKNTVRTIYGAYIKQVNDNFVINIKGNSFLRSMVRMITASCLYETKQEIIDKLNLKSNKKFKKILQPNGLYLKEVSYD